MNTPRCSAGAARPFLKWVGGKRRVLPHLDPLLPASFRRYVEPFLGGGALFFHLAARESMAGRAVLCDANERLARTYRAVRDEPEALIERLREHATAHALHGKDHFDAQKARAIDTDADVEVAAWLIYLNKAGFNGLYRVNRQGRFNVAFGDYAQPLICDADNLRACAEALRGVRIRCGDFADLADEEAGAGDLVYFDPPYVPTSATASFASYTADGFSGEDQTRLRDLARVLAARGVHVLLSNADVPAARALYAKGFHLHALAVGRSVSCAADRRGRAGELLVQALLPSTLETTVLEDIDDDTNETDDIHDPLSPVEEGYAEALGVVCRTAEDLRTEHGLWGAIPEVFKTLDLLPGHLHDEALVRIVRLSTLLPELRPLGELRELVRETTTRYPERSHLRSSRVDLRWKSSPWKSKGAAVLGKPAAVPRAERECWRGGEDEAPAFRLTVNLAYWILASEAERARLVHQKLGLCRWSDSGEPQVGVFDLEDLADTLARFGLQNDNGNAALAALAIWDHPETPIHIREVRPRQQQLFAPVWERKKAAEESPSTGTSSDVDLELERQRTLQNDPEFARAVAAIVRPDEEGTHVSMTFTNGRNSVTVTSDDVPRLEQAAAKAERKKGAKKNEPAAAAPSETTPAGETLEKVAHLLGTMPDAELGRQIGVTAALVSHARRQRKIPAYIEPSEPRP